MTDIITNATFYYQGMEIQQHHAYRILGRESYHILVNHAKEHGSARVGQVTMEMAPSIESLRNARLAAEFSKDDAKAERIANLIKKQRQEKRDPSPQLPYFI